MSKFLKVDFETQGSAAYTIEHKETHQRITDILEEAHRVSCRRRADEALAAGIAPSPDPEPIVPRTWQAGVAHELLQGNDVVLKAGTGSGKTLAFQAVSMLNPDGIVLVISPLTSLMYDQVERAAELGITATSLTAEAMAADPGLVNKVRDGQFRLVYISAEMIQSTNDKWKVIIGSTKRGDSVFFDKLSLIVIDEAHLIREWRKFRPVYRDLGLLRLRWDTVPILACSGTLPKYVLDYMHTVLKFKRKTLLCDLDTDRPNIVLMTAPIKHGKTGTREQLNFVVPEAMKTCAPEDFWSLARTVPKTIIFADDKKLCVAIASQLLRRCPVWSRRGAREAEVFIREYHSVMSPEGKERNMASFRDGTTRILICTEAVGMGVDIPDVERVVQWKLPEFLTISGLWQRFGRAARSPAINGLGVIFFESAFNVDGALQGAYDNAEERAAVEELHLARDVAARRYEQDDGEPELKRARRGGKAGSHKPKGALIERREQHVLWLCNSKGCIRVIALDYLGSRVIPRDGIEVPCCDRCMEAAGYDPDLVQVFPMRDTMPYIDQEAKWRVPAIKVEPGPVPPRTKSTTYEVECRKRQGVAVAAALKVYRSRLMRTLPKGTFLREEHVLSDDWIANIVRKVPNELETVEDLQSAIGGGKINRLPHSIVGARGGGQRLLEFIKDVVQRAVMPEFPKHAPGQPHIMTPNKPVYDENELTAEWDVRTRDLMHAVNMRVAEFDQASFERREQRRLDQAAARSESMSQRSRASTVVLTPDVSRNQTPDVSRNQTPALTQDSEQPPAAKIPADTSRTSTQAPVGDDHGRYNLRTRVPVRTQYETASSARIPASRRSESVASRRSESVAPRRSESVAPALSAMRSESLAPPDESSQPAMAPPPAPKRGRPKGAKDKTKRKQRSNKKAEDPAAEEPENDGQAA